MKAVFLAAGKGTRLQPVTNYLPKPMIDFWGKPFMEYTLNNLSQTEEIEEIIIIVNYKKELIKDHFGDQYKGTKISYINQDQSTGGTADAISYASGKIKNDFIAILGDVYLSIEHIKQLVNNSGTVLSATKIDDPKNHKIIDLKGDKVNGFSNNGNWADLGFWRLTPQIFKLIEKYRPQFASAEEVKMLPIIESGLNKLKPTVNFNKEPWIQIGDHMEVEGVLIAKDFLGEKYYNKEKNASSIKVQNGNCKIDNSIIFGPGKLTNSTVKNSLVYLNQKEDNLDLKNTIWAD